MKAVLVTDAVRKGDGQGRVAYEVAKCALASGIQVSLMAATVDPELIQIGARWLPIHGKKWPAHLFTEIETVNAATRTLKRGPERYDIIHAFGYTLKCAHDINSSQFVHAAWLKSSLHILRRRKDLNGLYQWIFTALNARWERRAYLHARHVVACSLLVKKELTEIGVPAARIQVITNGADPTEFAPGTACRSEFGLPMQGVIALFAGDIRTPRKNLDTVLRALVKAPEVQLAVLGSVDGSPYPRLARQLHVSDRVHFLGFRSDVNRVMQASDVFIFPSRYEPFGNVVIEAMATGLPIITAVTVGAAAFVTPECGFVLPNPEDAVALAAALQTLANDPSLRASMGNTARKAVQEQTWRRLSKEYVQIYERCGARKN